MAKLTYEEVKDQLTASKQEKNELNKELASLRKKHKLKKGDKPEDAKLAKQVEKLEAKSEALATKIETLSTQAKELKPKKERTTKYEYPEVTENGKSRSMNKEEKKNYRAKARAEAKRAEKAAAKAEAGEDAPKKAKKSSKKEAPAEKAAPATGKKKKKVASAMD